MDKDLAQVIAAERELLTPVCRTDPVRVRQLLADDFQEIGASGRLWDRDSMLAALGTVYKTRAQVIRDVGMQARRLADDLVLLTYTSVSATTDGPERRARRSSLWRQSHQGWCLVHHQGTPIHPGSRTGDVNSP